MKTFSINTVGCKINQYESQQIRQLLEQLGLSQAQTSRNKPDIVVINTCCVTLSASSKSRQQIRKAQKLSPDATIVVCGCLPEIQIGELNTPGKNTHIISHRESIAATLSQIICDKTPGSSEQNPQLDLNSYIRPKKSLKIKYKNKLTKLPKLPQLTSFQGHTRAFLKIQDGCDGYCSYCIIPKTRPFVHYKPIEAVLAEAEALVRAGHKEIVITGVFVGAYGQDSVRRKKWAEQQNDKLADLLVKLTEIPNLVRIRLSSLEPADVTQRLLDVFANNPKIMPQLHLPLQSGSNEILKKMGRQYSADEFREKIALIKAKLNRPAITADIIVGFPGETDADFEATVEVAKEAGFAKMHVFTFSKRPGTAAASLQGTVKNEVMKERSQILRDLDVELSYKFRQQFIGEDAEILIENNNGQCKGRSERYFMVYIEEGESKPKKGEIVKVKIIKNNSNGATALLY